MPGLSPICLQAVADELRSLAMVLVCCDQELTPDQSFLLSARIQEKLQRLRAMMREPLHLVDCNDLARADLREIVDWLDAVESQFEDIAPPFRVPEVGLVDTLASAFDRHAHYDAKRGSAAPPFTELERRKLQETYGATEYLRRRWAGEPDDAVERINAGMTTAIRRFPETRCWTTDEWSWLFSARRMWSGIQRYGAKLKAAQLHRWRMVPHVRHAWRIKRCETRCSYVTAILIRSSSSSCSRI